MFKSLFGSSAAEKAREQAAAQAQAELEAKAKAGSIQTSHECLRNFYGTLEKIFPALSSNPVRHENHDELQAIIQKPLEQVLAQPGNLERSSEIGKIIAACLTHTMLKNSGAVFDRLGCGTCEEYLSSPKSEQGNATSLAKEVSLMLNRGLRTPDNASEESKDVQKILSNFTQNLTGMLSGGKTIEEIKKQPIDELLKTPLQQATAAAVATPQLQQRQ